MDSTYTYILRYIPIEVMYIHEYIYNVFSPSSKQAVVERRIVGHKEVGLALYEGREYRTASVACPASHWPQLSSPWTTWFGPILASDATYYRVLCIQYKKKYTLSILAIDKCEGENGYSLHLRNKNIQITDCFTARSY